MRHRGSVSPSTTEKQSSQTNQLPSQESQGAESQASATGMSQDFMQLDVSDVALLPAPTAGATGSAGATPTAGAGAAASGVSTRRSSARIATAATSSQEYAADVIGCLSVDSQNTLSIGTVCVMQRSSSNKKQKVIKKFAMQKTFYAYPKNATTEQKNKVETRIQNDVADFILQGYEVHTHKFGLPFEVEEICCVSRGYNLLPKILKAARVVGAKRKTVSSSSSEESDKDDCDEIMHDHPAPPTRTLVVAKRTRK